MSLLRDRVLAERNCPCTCDFCLHAKKRSEEEPCDRCVRGGGFYDVLSDEFDPDMREDIEAAVAAAKERCAKICDQAADLYNYATAKECASKIRGEK